MFMPQTVTCSHLCTHYPPHPYWAASTTRHIRSPHAKAHSSRDGCTISSTPTHIASPGASSEKVPNFCSLPLANTHKWHDLSLPHWKRSGQKGPEVNSWNSPIVSSPMLGCKVASSCCLSPYCPSPQCSSLRYPSSCFFPLCNQWEDHSRAFTEKFGKMESKRKGEVPITMKRR